MIFKQAFAKPLRPEDLPRTARWLALLLISAILWGFLDLVGVPAALLLGPMLAGIIIEAGGGAVRVPPLLYLAAQAAVGGFVAGAVQPTILSVIGSDWPLFVGLVMSMVVVTSLAGWLMSRWRLLPATTAVWGTSPGAAATMIIMAEAFGADIQLVAFMQYLRVALIAVVASVIAGLSGHGGVLSPAHEMFSAPKDWRAVAETLALVAVGGFIGSRSRIPAGTLLVPMGAGIALHAAGWIAIELPRPLIAASYALIGWRIGLGFTRPILIHAARVLPVILASIFAAITFSGILALLLARFLGMDLLTAYLATSPGGMDSIAVIAASARVDLSFVMALQTARFLIVMIVGPPLARFVARRSGRLATPGPEASGQTIR
ncbi:MAG TPA: AbrB family transcriptional regulator [Alphaproteobacteria bacterium]|nr:AbrB family transcriptional regulator [Alphaproteobacteria bacterium]